jgi:hypothetical protein
MRSAGLLADAICLRSHPVLNYRMWESPLATKVFHLVADVANHESTIVESCHNKILSVFKFNAGTVFCIKCGRSKAPHNSNFEV